MANNTDSNMGAYFGSVGKNEDSFNSKDDFITGSKTYNCFPSSLRISKAYRTYIHIIDERNNNSVTNVIAVCPQSLNFGFDNKWGTIEPFKMSGGSWVQAGVQTFGNGRTGFLGREISTIHYWEGGSAIKMSLTVQLYAEKYDEVDEKIFKPLKVLANLAQPSTKPGSDALIAPGPAPFKFNLKYRGIKLKNVRDAKTGKTEKKADEDANGVAKLTDYQIDAGKGVQTDIKIGDWFYLTDVLVDKVTIDIPMNLAKKYRNSTGTAFDKQSDIDNQIKANSDIDKKLSDLDEREKTLATEHKKQEDIITQCKQDEETIKGYRGQIDDLNKSISGNQEKLAKEQEKLTTNEKTVTQTGEWIKNCDTYLSYYAKTTKDYKEISDKKEKYNNQRTAASKEVATNKANITDFKTKISADENTREHTQKSLDTKLEQVGGDTGLAKTKAAAEKTKTNIENAQNQIPGERQSLQDQKTAGNSALRTLKGQLQKDSQAKPFMATIKLDIRTKYQTTQEDFNKMLSGIPVTKKLVDLDIRENGVMSVAANLLLSAIPGVEQNDMYGRNTEVINQKQEDSKPPENQSTSSKAGEAVKNANQKQEKTESSSSWWNPTTWF